MRLTVAGRIDPSSGPWPRRIDLHTCTAPRPALDGAIYGSVAVTNYVRIQVATAQLVEHADGPGDTKTFPISYSIAYGAARLGRARDWRL